MEIEQLDLKVDEEKIENPVYSGGSVAVFSLGFAGFLVPVLGIVPSLISLVKAQKAKKELIKSEGKVSGFGLINAGIALAVLGILNFFVSIALVFGAVWAVNQIPVWLEENFSSSGLLGNTLLTDALPPVNINELGLDDNSVQQLESLLPEGTSLDSVDISALLELLESSGGIEGLTGSESIDLNALLEQLNY